MSGTLKIEFLRVSMAIEDWISLSNE